MEGVVYSLDNLRPGTYTIQQQGRTGSCGGPRQNITVCNTLVTLSSFTNSGEEVNIRLSQNPSIGKSSDNHSP